jgi:hypothetical protein
VVSPTPQQTVYLLTVEILDSAGRLAKTVFQGNAGAPSDTRVNPEPFLMDGTSLLTLACEGGDWQATWDGRDHDGLMVQPGLYFARAHWQAAGLDQSRVTPFTVVPATRGLTKGMFLIPNPAGSGNRPDEVTLFWVPGAPDMTLRVEVYNMAGERVRHFLVPASRGRLLWDLRTPSGQAAANGLYLVRVGILSANQEVIERKILKLAIQRD